MTHRPPKLPLARRIIAAGCAALWLVAVSACNLEALFCCDSHGGDSVGHEDQEHSHEANGSAGEDPAGDTDHALDIDAHQSNEADGHSHDSSEHGGKNGSCCSTLTAVAQASTPSAFSKPAFQLNPFLCVPLVTHATSLAVLMSPPYWGAKTFDRVLTPEVCRGPAFQSNAPPVVG